MKTSEYNTRRGRLVDTGALPWIVCLCGSTKFKDAFIENATFHTMAGRIVLTVTSFGHTDGTVHTPNEKADLDELHKRKIDLADEVVVLNVGGYIGESTKSEIAYATRIGVPVLFLEDPNEIRESNAV